MNFELNTQNVAIIVVLALVFYYFYTKCNENFADGYWDKRKLFDDRRKDKKDDRKDDDKFGRERREMERRERERRDRERRDRGMVGSSVVQPSMIPTQEPAIIPTQEPTGNINVPPVSPQENTSNVPIASNTNPTWFYVPNSSYPSGINYGAFATIEGIPSPIGCQQTCQEDNNCIYSIYSETNQDCVKGNYIGIQAYPMSLSVKRNDNTYKTYQNGDIGGYVIQQVNNESIAQCEQLCDNEPDCASYTYLQPGSGIFNGNSVCFTKGVQSADNSLTMFKP